jgi:hypothetical protein
MTRSHLLPSVLNIYSDNAITEWQEKTAILFLTREVELSIVCRQSIQIPQNQNNYRKQQLLRQETINYLLKLSTIKQKQVNNTVN